MRPIIPKSGIVAMSINNQRRTTMPIDELEGSHEQREWRLMFQVAAVGVDAGVDQHAIDSLMKEFQILEELDMSGRNSSEEYLVGQPSQPSV